MEKCEKFQMAEKTHLRGLEVDPLCVRNLQGYAQFLRTRGEEGWAHRFEAKEAWVRENEGKIMK